MSVTELILLRHGETDWNRQRRVQGHLDQPLNVRGAQQAIAAAVAVQSLDQQRAFDHVIVSDLARARQTANHAAIHLEHTHQVNPMWRERNFGLLEGMTHDEMLANQPTAYAGWKSGEPDFLLETGESLRQFSARVEEVLFEALHRFEGQRVLVVTHGGVVDMARRVVEAQPLSMPRGYEIPNCSLSSIHKQNGILSLGNWVQAEHLEGLL